MPLATLGLAGLKLRQLVLVLAKHKSFVRVAQAAYQWSGEDQLHLLRRMGASSNSADKIPVLVR